MSSGRTEHFCTLFDSGYLPLGLALYDSLRARAQPAHLWVVCMDEAVEEQLRRLRLPGLTLLPLREVETAELLRVKDGRSRGEYCWTLTPFAPSAVFARDPEVERVTYLDADLFFFRDPRLLLQELEESGKDVLITEHAYAPEYDQSAISGRFCVQFLTFRRTAAARAVLGWWQERCVEWCFARPEDGRFGDQKYLDDWPLRFADAVHVVRRTERTLAPWNARMFEERDGALDPVFYHFHGVRLFANRWIRWVVDYRLGAEAGALYRAYSSALREALARMAAAGIPTPAEPVLPRSGGGIARLLKRIVVDGARYHRL